MAPPYFAVATQILIDGPRNTVVKITGDITVALAQTTVVTASALSSMLPAMQGSFPPTLLRVDRISYSITDGIIVQLLWNATTDVPIAELYGRGQIEGKEYGGLQNNAGAGVTGNIDIQVEPSGAAMPTDSSLLIIMELVKNRPTA
jgi:hypothetical protein